MRQDRLPSFLGIGPKRTGTNWLRDNLNAHPQIFVPSGEPSFFCAAQISELDMRRYADLFANADGHHILGELSPAYFSCSASLQNIHSTLPSVKLICLLRDPVERLYAEYRMGLNLLAYPTNTTLAQAIDCFSLLIRNSSYGSILRAYLDKFPREQMYIDDFSRIRTEPETLLAEIYHFLGASKEFASPRVSIRRKATGTIRYPWINNIFYGTAAFMRSNGMGFITRYAKVSGFRKRITRWLYRYNVNRARSYPEISPQERKMLIDRLLPEIELLEDLLCVEFTSWKEV